MCMRQGLYTSQLEELAHPHHGLLAEEYGELLKLLRRRLDVE